MTTRRNFLGASGALLVQCAVRSATSQTVTSAPGQSEKQVSLVDDLVLANRILADQGVLDSYGHVSARLPAPAEGYLLSRSLAPEMVRAGDLFAYNLSSQPMHPETRGQYLERFIHGEIYRVRPDVQAIVHCHSPDVIPFGVCSVALQPVYHMAAFIGLGVPVFDIRKFAGMSDMIVRDPALGADLARTLGDKPALLMRGHGAVIVGSSLRQAVGRSVYLGLNARLQMQAIALGGKVQYLSPEESRKSGAPDDYRRAWTEWKRKVGPITP